MKIKKALIIRLSSLGDVILALPVANSINRADPEISVGFVTSQRYAPLLAHSPDVDNVHVYASRQGASNSLRSLIDELRRQKYDVVIDLQKNPRSVIMTALLNPLRVVSYPKRRLQRELQIRHPSRRSRIGHTVDAYLRTLSWLGIEPVSRQPHLELKAGMREFGKSFVKQFRLTENIVGMCPGSKHFEKQWPGFPPLAGLLLTDANMSVVVFKDLLDEFDPDLGISSDRLAAADSMPIDKIAGVMAQCDVVVSNDSGLMHLAAALSVPVIGIFGPTHPVLGFAPLGATARVICDDVPCSPCSLHGEKKCRMPRKFCFEKITPWRVKKEVDAVIHELSRGKILRKTPR